MKNTKLTKEEKELTKAIKTGDFKSTPHFSQSKGKYAQIAKNTLRKNYNYCLVSSLLFRVLLGKMKLTYSK